MKTTISILQFTVPFKHSTVFTLVYLFYSVRILKKSYDKLCVSVYYAKLQNIDRNEGLGEIDYLWFS